MNSSKFLLSKNFKFVVIGIVAVALALSGFSALAVTRKPENSVLAVSSLSQADKISTLEFQNSMRKLWEEHVTWTRLYIISVAGNLPDQDVTAQRLLQNQADIGNAIKPFYGDAAGDQLTALLRQHILTAAAILADVKAGNSTQAQTDIQSWYSNADQIAAFLNGANPKNWPLAALKEQMKTHLDLTLLEAGDRLNGKYSMDIQDYDRIENHILLMSDLLSNGIIRQFPDRFTH